MTDIDESLYSRQLYVLGHEAMRRMQASNILIAGMGGLGIEVAKNIILAGVKSVTIHDKHDTSFHDLSTQFYLKESDISKNRAKCSLVSLSELNSYVPIDLYDGELSEDILRKFQVVILTDSSHEEQIRIGKFCHSSGIKFLCAETAGVFGKIFCDFGPQFIVNDVNGQAAKCAMISFISKDTTGVVTTFDDQRHDLEDDSYVIFSEVKGMHELNGKEFKIKVLGPYSFSIGDTSSLTSYESGGVITEVKKPKLIDFKPIDVATLHPEYLVSDYTKMQDTDTIHLAFQALSEFKQKNSHTPPRPWNKIDAENFVDIVESLNTNLEKPFHDLNKQLLELFASISSGNLCPLNSVIGGMLAQEAMKAVSGKFHPVVQYFYFDCRECLPENYYELITNSNKLELNKSSRYLAQEIVFGSEFQKKLESLQIFLVGSGALGCEYIKNFAMMGLCTNEAKGKLTVTDMDTIEKSNLNRQFLFRSWDVQKHKAEVSSRAAKAMNPAINIEVNLNRVGPETENFYTEEFFDSLDLVCNALDNVKARLYIDARCVQSLKPLIESGTLGTSANSQIILPMLTESYSSSQDPPEKTIPLCTLKNFPNAIEHTLQWARDRFEGLFCSPAMATLNYLNEPEKFLNNLRKLTTNQQLEELEKLESILVKNKCTCFKDCVIWARNNFEEFFSNMIKQLLFNFPEDLKTEAGLPFWSGLKRCPHPLKFQPTNSLHLEYILASANLMAFMHGIKQSNNRNELEHMLKNIKVAEFQPKSGVVIKVNDSDETNDLNDDEELKANELMSLFENHSSFKASHSKIFPIEFEKDDDTNYHMDFITACSNLRAENYDIAPTDKHNSKLIAGRIIPAIATTTALIVGLDCIELYKIVQGHKKLERYKNSYVNLALPFFSASEPMPVAKNKFNNRDWSFWDRIDVSGGLSLVNFLDHIQKEFKINVDMINCGLVTLYSSYSNPEAIKRRREMKLNEIYEEIRKEKLSEKIKSILLDISCSDLQGNDIDFFPTIKYYL